MYVHVYGLYHCGLGNILFQVAAAIYYAEKYKYKIILKRTYPICYGTSNMFGREKMSTMGIKQYKTYDKTIFKKFMFDNGYVEDSIVVSNYFSDTKINPEGRHIIIDCYSQNIQLFYEYIHEIPKYLYLEDPEILCYIKNKYPTIENENTNSVCLGVRFGKDFEHKLNIITANSYKKALDFYKSQGIEIKNVFIISDVKNTTELLNLGENYNCIEVDENDIVQIYCGMMCDNFILSESTFHLWIAYLAVAKNKEKKVVCFNNTDITNRNLHFPDWYRIDY